jgi:hypothetical protein
MMSFPLEFPLLWLFKIKKRVQLFVSLRYFLFFLLFFILSITDIYRVYRYLFDFLRLDGWHGDMPVFGTCSSGAHGPEGPRARPLPASRRRGTTLECEPVPPAQHCANWRVGRLSPGTLVRGESCSCSWPVHTKRKVDGEGVRAYRVLMGGTHTGRGWGGCEGLQGHHDWPIQ